MKIEINGKKIENPIMEFYPEDIENKTLEQLFEEIFIDPIIRRNPNV